MSHETQSSEPKGKQDGNKVRVYSNGDLRHRWKLLHNDTLVVGQIRKEVGPTKRNWAWHNLVRETMLSVGKIFVVRPSGITLWLYAKTQGPNMGLYKLVSRKLQYMKRVIFTSPRQTYWCTRECWSLGNCSMDRTKR